MNFKNESITEKQKRAYKVFEFLFDLYPNAKIQLNFSSPFELLVATMLSAQCTDERVNIVTGELFNKYTSIDDFVKVGQDDLEKDIFSTGFYKAKAKHIKSAALIIKEKYHSIVPNTMEELLTLPGVGRKTANVVLGHCFDIPGIVVDTHVSRISQRLMFTLSNNPEKIEFDLMELFAQNKWIIVNHLFISFGRGICTSRKPKCSECKIIDFCDFVNKGNQSNSL
jgi:endonuclease III